MSQALDTISIRQVTPADFPVIRWWLDSRQVGKEYPLEQLPPKLGRMVEVNGNPIMCSFLFMVIGIGFAYLEGLATKPGLDLRTLRKAEKLMIAEMKEFARANDYGQLHVRTTPTIARELERQLGFEVLARDLILLGISTGLE